jgi:hypothetical protein
MCRNHQPSFTVSHVDRCLGRPSGDALHFRLPRTHHRRPPSLSILSKSPRLPVGVDQSSGPTELGGCAAPSREEPVRADTANIMPWTESDPQISILVRVFSLLCKSQLESGMQCALLAVLVVTQQKHDGLGSEPIHRASAETNLPFAGALRAVPGTTPTRPAPPMRPANLIATSLKSQA